MGLNRRASAKQWLGFVTWFVSLSGAASPFAAADYADRDIVAVQTEKEGQIRALRDAEITQIRIALGRRLEKNRQAELYFRLAELYLEGYRLEFMLEGRVFENKLKEQSRGIRLDRGRSRQWIRKGLQACADIDRLGARPSPRMDSVLYFRAFFLNELDERAESLKVYRRMVAEFPNSPLVGEAFEAMALDLFDRNRFKEAVPVFERAISKVERSQSARPAKLAILFHKLAWCHYRLRRFDQAMVTMKKAISIARKSEDGFLSIREEALRDMAVFYTERGRVDEALAYFAEVAGDESFFAHALEKLGKEYERTLKIAEAIRTYESLLKARPDDEVARRVHVHLVELDLKRGDPDSALRRASQPDFLNRLYSARDTHWDNLRAWIRKTATQSHQEFQKKNVRAKLKVAEAFYGFYVGTLLKMDDSRQETQEIKLYLAEVKRELGKPNESANLYKEIIRSGETKFAKQAGLLWMQSLELSLQKLKQEGKATKSTAPSELEREFVEATDLYLTAKPDAWSAALKAAQVLAGYKETQAEAVRRIGLLLDEAPRTKEAWTGANLWLQLNSDALVVDRLRKEVALIENDARNHQGKLLQRLNELERNQWIQTIAEHEKSSRWQEAIDGYTRLVRSTSVQNQIETAYGRMVDLADLAQDSSQMIKFAMEWFRRYPKSPRAMEGMRSVATRLLIYGAFQSSAEAFEQLGLTSQDDKSLETAARISEGQMDFLKSRSTRLKFLRIYPKSPLAQSVLISLAQMSDGVQAIGYLKQCLAVSGTGHAECKAKLGDAYLGIKDYALADQWFGKAASHAKDKTSTDQLYGTYAMVRRAELYERSIDWSPLKTDSSAGLGASLKKRLEQIQSLRARYQAVIGLGGPWGIMALTRLAEVTERVETELKAAGPLGATLVDTLRQQINTANQQAYQQAIKSKILSPAVPRLHHHLALRKAAKARDAQGVFARMRIVGASPADAGTEWMDRTRKALIKNPRNSQSWVDYGNLLWGEKRPLMAQIAYDRAIALDEQSPAAINNRGVVEFLKLAVGAQPAQMAEKSEWVQALDAMAHFQRALALQDTFLAAHYNRAALWNYYRLFELSQPAWERVIAQSSVGDAWLGLAMAQLGNGALEASEQSLRKAESLGAEPGVAERIYWNVARTESKDACRESVGAIDTNLFWGFEKQGIIGLRETCEQWNDQKSSR